MRELDWSNERYVRTHTRDTAEWILLGWDAQCLWLQLSRKMDRAGVLQLDRSVEPWENVFALFPYADPERIQQGLDALIARKWLIHDPKNAWLMDPEFTEKDETSLSDKQRQRESRHKRKARDAYQRVTKRDGMTGDGTADDQNVTPSEPSYPSKPSHPSRPEGEGEGGSKKKLSRSQADMARVLAVFTAAGVDPPTGKVLGGYGKALKAARETWGETQALDRVVEVLAGISWQNIENPAPYGLKVLNNAIQGKVQPMRGRRRGRDQSASQGTIDSAGAFG